MEPHQRTYSQQLVCLCMYVCAMRLCLGMITLLDCVVPPSFHSGAFYLQLSLIKEGEWTILTPLPPSLSPSSPSPA